MTLEEALPIGKSKDILNYTNIKGFNYSGITKVDKG